jgi:circadian clock protein KaiB
VAPKNEDEDTRRFEETLARQEGSGEYTLRLFVTGTTPRSLRAIQNIRAICDEKLEGRYHLEVIDIYQHPELMQKEQIVVAPTLVKSLPLPVRRLIGDLSNKDRILVGLDLLPRPAAT